MALFELPQAIWRYLDAVQESQRRQAEALESIAAQLSDVATMLEEIRVTLKEQGEDKAATKG